MEIYPWTKTMRDYEEEIESLENKIIFLENKLRALKEHLGKTNLT